MPKLNQKEKVLGGRAEVLSYQRDPSTWFYRQYQPSTRSYRSERIAGATCLQEAIDAAPDYYQPADTKRPDREARRTGSEAIRTAKPRRKGELLTESISNWLKLQMQRVDSGLLKLTSYSVAENTLINGLAPYFKAKNLSLNTDLTVDSLRDYPTFRRKSGVVSKLTLRKEHTELKRFFIKYMVKRGLLSQEIAFDDEFLFSVRVKEEDLLSNPAINSTDWELILQAIDSWADAKQSDNWRGRYFHKLFKTWCLAAKATGARPEELLKLQWRDIEHINVSQQSDEELQANTAHLLAQGIHPSTLPPDLVDSIAKKDRWVSLIRLKSSKTGNLRTVPCNLTELLDGWRDYQQGWIKDHNLKHEVTPNSYVWANPHNEGKLYTYAYFRNSWQDSVGPIRHRLKGHWISDKPYTIYSMRTSFIEDQLMAGVSPLIVAEMAGHDIKILYKIYQKLNIRMMAGEITNKTSNSTGNKRASIRPSL